MKFTISNIEKLREEYENLKNCHSEEIENLKFSFFNGCRRAVVFKLRYGINRLNYGELYLHREDALTKHKSLPEVIRHKELKEVYVADLNMSDVLSLK